MRYHKQAVPLQYFYPRPRVEGDEGVRVIIGRQNYFYPRPRVEGDSSRLTAPPPPVQFLSTPSRRGRRCTVRNTRTVANFYPRPRVEGDMGRGRGRDNNQYFYPRPRVEGDVSAGPAQWHDHHFYPRPRVEGDRLQLLIFLTSLRFLSTPSRRGRRNFAKLLFDVN